MQNKGHEPLWELKPSGGIKLIARFQGHETAALIQAYRLDNCSAQLKVGLRLQYQLE
jgi:hypothetical protein